MICIVVQMMSVRFSTKSDLLNLEQAEKKWPLWTIFISDWLEFKKICSSESTGLIKFHRDPVRNMAIISIFLFLIG